MCPPRHRPQSPDRSSENSTHAPVDHNAADRAQKTPWVVAPPQPDSPESGGAAAAGACDSKDNQHESTRQKRNRGPVARLRRIGLRRRAAASKIGVASRAVRSTACTSDLQNRRVGRRRSVHWARAPAADGPSFEGAHAHGPVCNCARRATAKIAVTRRPLPCSPWRRGRAGRRVSVRLGFPQRQPGGQGVSHEEPTDRPGSPPGR
jgi:hypothetical protein